MTILHVEIVYLLTDSESIAAKDDDLSPVVKKPRIQPKGNEHLPIGIQV